MNRHLVLVLLAVVMAAGAIPGAALADGLPGPGVDAGPEGVEEATGEARYVTAPAGDGTMVLRVEQHGGEVVRSKFLRSRFVVPVVAYDGTAAGVSADGRTLVLVRPRERFPRAVTPFVVLDAQKLRLRKALTLRGDFSFDALSPDGSLLYLIQYVSPRNFTRYVVRAFDLRAGKLLPKPIVDPRESGTMQGAPITRAALPDGRWAYTLYDGAGGHPFIHALDTENRTARCIDLHELAGFKRLYDLRLRFDAEGTQLTVHDRGRPLALVDTTSFRVTEPRPVVRPARTRPAARPAERAGSVPWLAAVAGGVAVALAAGGLVAARWGRWRAGSGRV